MFKKENMKNVKKRVCKIIALSSVAMMTFASAAGVNKLDVYAANAEVLESQTLDLRKETPAGEDQAPTAGFTGTDIDGNDCARLENTFAALSEAGQIKEYKLNDVSNDPEAEAFAKAMKVYDLDLDSNPDVLVMAFDMMGVKTFSVSVLNTRNYYWRVYIKVK